MNAITLIKSQGGPRVDSRVLAKQMGNQHKNTMELIERYASEFLLFDHLPFQTEVGKRAQGGGKAERFALLNEDQAFFLLTLSRNTERVVELKSNLIVAFRETRYRYACQYLESRTQEASQNGRSLARFRWEKPGLEQGVAYLQEQLKLPIDLEDVR